MSLGSINSISPFSKPFGMNVSSGSAVRPIGQGSIFGEGQSKGAPVSKNSSIFGSDFNININSVSGVNPFSSVNKTSPMAGIAPSHARENFRNGLAPSDDLQNVYAGSYNGKPNILNQIAIA